MFILCNLHRFFPLKVDDPSLLNGIFRNVARNRDGNCAFLAILPTNPLCIRKLARRQAIFCCSICHTRKAIICELIICKQFEN